MSNGPELLYAVGDRVRVRIGHTVVISDGDLGAEGEDPTVRFQVPTGAVGTVKTVRQYTSPYPYVILLDDGREFGEIEINLARVDQEPQPEPRTIVPGIGAVYWNE